MRARCFSTLDLPEVVKGRRPGVQQLLELLAADAG